MATLGQASPEPARVRALQNGLMAGTAAADAEQWWQAYQVAEDDQADELRTRADHGDEHARPQLASWLADRVRTEEAIEIITPLADAGDEHAVRFLAENPDWRDAWRQPW
jgi:hypothetical protein